MAPSSSPLPGCRAGATVSVPLPHTRETRANAPAYDTAARAELWSRSLELVGHADVP